ncbi:MAG: response regulator, partial [candidate division Zixibacteria bacterium]|nr:response regulator [candidate division Zixibacteria bacterium]
GKIELRIEERELEQDDKRKINAGKHIKIEIEDKGDGIPENILNKIFDPFFTTKEKGTGLGLATSYSIIKNHQGCIFVTSKKGRGTKFTIYLPMTKVVKEETVSEKLSDFKGDGRILVIDDEEAIRLLLKRILTMSGYEVETVSCSEEGFALYREGIIKDNRFSAVIIDLTLPGDESGDKVLKRIKSVDPDVKAIVSSGYSNDPIMANYCDYGFSGILTKPYKADIVRKTLYFILQD